MAGKEDDAVFVSATMVENEFCREDIWETGKENNGLGFKVGGKELMLMSMLGLMETTAEILC